MIKELIETLVSTADDEYAGSLSTLTVPMPTAEYRAVRKLSRAAAASAPPPLPIPIPIPLPVLTGPRVLLWKQDPSVAEIGIRKAFLPSLVASGPKDTRIQITGVPTVTPNSLGDFIQTPLTAEFDGVHTFAVVRMTLTMYQRALATGPSLAALPWQWNNAQNTDPITVVPRHSSMMNAFYSRQNKQLAFGFFPKPNAPAPAPTIFTCRSFDIVAHECGHAILDGLKPQWIASNATAQTGALHEAFGDLTAIFLTLSQLDQVEAIIAQTKSNLHDKTFLSDVAEEFGLALGRSNGLRNADNDLRLSQVGTEVHALSQVFTGAIYDVLADLFTFERKLVRDDAATLYERAAYLRSVLLRGIVQAPANNATFADVASKMLSVVTADGAAALLSPSQVTAYRNSIRNRFMLRDLVLPTAAAVAGQASFAAIEAALRQDVHEDEVLAPAPHISLSIRAGQNRQHCCGTMTLPEHNGINEAMEQERMRFLDDLKTLAGAKSGK